MHEDPLSGRAALARAQITGGERRIDGSVEVGVIHHHERPVPTHLQQRGLAGSCLRDLPTRRGRADERNGVGPRVARDLVADDGARPGDEVESAGRQVGVGDAAGKRDGTNRGRRRRRPHDRVAAGERRRDQLGRHRVRPVPGADHANDAPRAADQQHPLPRGDRVGQLAGETLSVLGGHAPVLHELIDLVERLGPQRFALVKCQRPGELVATRLDDVADRVHRRGALKRGQAGPAAGRLACRGDRPLGVAPIALRNRGDQLTIGGADGVERVAARARLPLPADEHLARTAGGPTGLLRTPDARFARGHSSHHPVTLTPVDH
jgi:hypothetical protein